MANVRWLLLDVADVPAAIADGGPRHAEETGGAQISVTWNVAETQALVKIDGAGKNWRRGRPWITNCATANGVYDRGNRHLIFEWFYSPGWQAKEKPQ